MTETEIKEAIELVKKSHPYATKYKGVKEDEALQVLITLAEEYLKIEGWPEERGYLEKLENDNPYLTEDWNAGFNKALRLCKLAAMKEIEMLKEEAANDYADMRRFQERFIAADQELRALKEKYQVSKEKIAHIINLKVCELTIKKRSFDLKAQEELAVAVWELINGKEKK